MKDKQSLTYLGEYITKCQNRLGAIAWEPNGKVDPWDHVESIMALNLLDFKEEALKGFDWLISSQEQDGSWYSEYQGEKITNLNKETNFCAYISSGALHHFLNFKERSFLEKIWPTLKKSIEFVISGQTDEGDILWAKDYNEEWMDDSLLTGCASIFKSLNDFNKIAKTLGYEEFILKEEIKNLKDSIINKSERFDRTWESKARYSMDWYYPVLCGIYSKQDSKKIINERWDEFVVPGLGCKCVSEEPWVTVAESCELILALNKIDEKKTALEIFENISRLIDLKDKLFWTGYVYKDDKFWPIEKPSWTAAAVVLAANSLFEFNSTSNFFLRLLNFL